MQLRETLENRTWWGLRAVARAHNFPFPTRQTRQQATDYVATSLDRKQVKRTYRRELDKDDRDALKALQAVGGMMPLHAFTAVYGEVRPYKPWRSDHHKFPWKRPVSSAEKLYYFAFIDILRTGNGQPDYVYTTQEVLDLLPAPPRPKPSTQTGTAPTPQRTPETLCREVAVFLSLLLREEVRLLWGRWLAPRHMKALNARWQDKADLGRSELQSDRVRFVHYLCDVAGLVELKNGVLLPSVQAWQWLDKSPQERWTWLWECWHKDMRRYKNRQWDTYRLPAITRQQWQAWQATLRDYSAGDTQTLLRLVGLRAGAEAVVYQPDAVPEPLLWAGVVGVDGDGFVAVKPSSPALLPQGEGRKVHHGAANDILNTGDRPGVRSQTSHEMAKVPRPEGEGFRVRANLAHHGMTFDPHVGPLRPLVELLSIATVDADGARIDQAALQRAAERDMSAQMVCRLLAEHSGEPVPMAVYEQFVAWSQHATQFTLQPLLVLSSSDSQLLADVRANRYMRWRFAGTLGPNAVAVHPHEARKLQQQLTRRGFGVTTPQTEPAPISDQHTEYCYLAVRAYQKLARMVPQLVRVPGDVADDLKRQLPRERPGLLDQTADEMVSAVARSIEGYAPLMGGVEQDEPAAIREAIEQAFQTRGSLTIEYFSPAEGHITRRTIAPQLPIAHDNGADYIEAWCELAHASRTFRLDRILRVVE